jgi:carbonyl reductase 1
MRIALVTGGNKGIGYAICKGLALNSKSNIKDPITVLLASRDLQRGEEAKQKLQQEGITVHPIQLDITNQHSIQSAAAKIKEEYGALDILVHNAAIASKGDRFDYEVSRTTIDTNYYGTLHAHQGLQSLLRENSRVVFVSSGAGGAAFRGMSQQNRERFYDNSLTIDKLSALMEEFITDVKNNQWEAKGWPRSAYGMSKAGVTTLSRLFARDTKIKGIAINSVCPGLTSTDMSSQQGHSVEVGASIALKCALLPITETPQTGLFWKIDSPKPEY